MKKLITIAAMLVLSVPVFAQEKLATNEVEPSFHFKKGHQIFNEYQSLKANDDDFWSQAMYLGYVTGAVDIANGTLFCLPMGVTTGQVVNIVGQYLERNLQRHHFSGARLVAEALQEHYPCSG